MANPMTEQQKLRQLRGQVREVAVIVDELITRGLSMNPAVRCNLIGRVGRLKARISSKDPNERSVPWRCSIRCRGHLTARRIRNETHAKR